MNNKPIIAQVLLVPEKLYPLCHTTVEIDGIFESITVATLEGEPVVTVDAPSVGKYKLLPLALAQGLRAAKAKELGFFAELAELMDRYKATFSIDSCYDTEGVEADIVGSAKFGVVLGDGYSPILAVVDFSDFSQIEGADLRNYDATHEQWKIEQRAKDLKKEAPHAH